MYRLSSALCRDLEAIRSNHNIIPPSLAASSKEVSAVDVDNLAVLAEVGGVSNEGDLGLFAADVGVRGC